MTHSITSPQFKKQYILPKESYDCEMDSSYARRLYNQQIKGMRLSSSFHKCNYSKETSPKVGMEFDNQEDKAMEIEGNRENEGENSLSIKDFSAHLPKNSNFEFSNQAKGNETLLDKSSVYDCLEDLDSSQNVPVHSNNLSLSKSCNLSDSSFGDRYIPLRGYSKWETRYTLSPEVMIECSAAACVGTCRKLVRENSAELNAEYSCLLRNELLDTTIDTVKKGKEENVVTENRNIFQYQAQTRLTNCDSSFPLSPVCPSSQKLLRSPRKAARKISRIPYKVLDAPDLQDDFYLNLVDWSSQNILSVGLGSCVYLWSAPTCQVTKMCDFSSDPNSVTSVSWSERGNLIAVGTHHGTVQIWDVTVNKLVSKLVGHSSRVGAVAWNGDLLSSGSRDRMIIERDIRTPSNIGRKLSGHRQEVCGLKWSPDRQLLASGGNDNKLLVWNKHSSAPFQTYTEHEAAVKAIAWSPHHHGLLASGGGTADRCIRFWNTLTAQPVQSIDTGSQVCNLVWSKHSSEFVSTHGYSQNQILVWKYPTLTHVAKLFGHSYRVLYLAMSPDGESIVTGAGDETLRFWNVFSKVRCQRDHRSVLYLYRNIR